MNRKIIILHNKVTEQSNTDEADVLHQVNLVRDAYANLGYKPVSMELDEPFSTVQQIKNENPLFVSILLKRFMAKENSSILGRHC
ncbi:MAG: hypothetical protein HC906_05520 [Bacteroidales bacterium]|nr:hypothetical protein [Bacteroidales bacterium]